MMQRLTLKKYDIVNDLLIAKDIDSCLDKIENFIKITNDINYKDAKGFTLLYHACKENNVKLVTALLYYDNLDVNSAGHNGDTPLMIACFFGFNEVVKLLLAHTSIDINLVNDRNHDAFSYASMYQEKVTMGLLMQNGANIDLSNKYEELDQAIKKKSKELFDILNSKIIDIKQIDPVLLCYLICVYCELEQYDKMCELLDKVSSLQENLNKSLISKNLIDKNTGLKNTLVELFSVKTSSFNSSIYWKNILLECKLTLEHIIKITQSNLDSREEYETLIREAIILNNKLETNETIEFYNLQSRGVIHSLIYYYAKTSKYEIAAKFLDKISNLGDLDNLIKPFDINSNSLILKNSLISIITKSKNNLKTYNQWQLILLRSMLSLEEIIKINRKIDLSVFEEYKLYLKRIKLAENLANKIYKKSELALDDFKDGSIIFDLLCLFKIRMDYTSSSILLTQMMKIDKQANIFNDSVKLNDVQKEILVNLVCNFVPKNLEVENFWTDILGKSNLNYKEYKKIEDHVSLIKKKFNSKCILM